MISEYRVYKVFKDVVDFPFNYARTLSNGDVIGYFDVTKDEPYNCLSQVEILDYIKNNHVEEIEE